MLLGKYLMPDLQRNHHRNGFLSSAEMDGSEVTAYIYICDFWQSYSFGTFLIVNKQVFFVWSRSIVPCLDTVFYYTEGFHHLFDIWAAYIVKHTIDAQSPWINDVHLGQVHNGIVGYTGK